MPKKRTRSDLKEYQHLGAGRRTGPGERGLEWAVREAEGEQARAGPREPGHQGGEVFQEIICAQWKRRLKRDHWPL